MDEKVERFMKEAGENKLLKDNGIYVGKKSFHLFLAVMTSLFFLSLLLIAGWFGYLAYEGKFSSTVSQIVNPLFNASVLVNNNYEFNPSNEMYNDYQIKNNFTIYVNNFLDCP